MVKEILPPQRGMGSFSRLNIVTPLFWQRKFASFANYMNFDFNVKFYQEKANLP